MITRYELEKKDFDIIRNIFRKMETEYIRDLARKRDPLIDAFEYNELKRIRKELGHKYKSKK